MSIYFMTTKQYVNLFYDNTQWQRRPVEVEGYTIYSVLMILLLLLLLHSLDRVCGLQLVVFRSWEFFIGDETISVLILVVEDLFSNLVWILAILKLFFRNLDFDVLENLQKKNCELERKLKIFNTLKYNWPILGQRKTSLFVFLWKRRTSSSVF